MFFLGRGGGGLTAAIANAIAIAIAVASADLKFAIGLGSEFVGLFHGAFRIARPTERDPSFVMTRRDGTDVTAVVLGLAAFLRGIRFRIDVAATAAARSVLDVILIVMLAPETQPVSVTLQFAQEEGTLSFRRRHLCRRRRLGQFLNGIPLIAAQRTGTPSSRGTRSRRSGNFLLPPNESADSPSVNFRHEDVDEGSVGDDEVLTRDAAAMDGVVIPVSLASGIGSAGGKRIGCSRRRSGFGRAASIAIAAVGVGYDALDGRRSSMDVYRDHLKNGKRMRAARVGDENPISKSKIENDVRWENSPIRVRRK
mmetsp:Transcript_1410/g.3048  ORF Transcript_1410/g.3048 Transcript_1410/m.3048 type:complete len:311 (+) Transcript_1410:1050-1982(+)